jgi:hypothetical protein
MLDSATVMALAYSLSQCRSAGCRHHPEFASRRQRCSLVCVVGILTMVCVVRILTMVCGVLNNMVESRPEATIMYLKDKLYLANIFKRISASVTTVNEKIVAFQKKNISIEEMHAAVALEQLAIQHEALIVLATLVADPDINAELPVISNKITGFN